MQFIILYIINARAEGRRSQIQVGAVATGGMKFQYFSDAKILTSFTLLSLPVFPHYKIQRKRKRSHDHMCGLKIIISLSEQFGGKLQNFEGKAPAYHLSSPIITCNDWHYVRSIEIKVNKMFRQRT